MICYNSIGNIGDNELGDIVVVMSLEIIVHSVFDDDFDECANECGNDCL